MYDFHTHFIPPDVITWIKDNRRTIHAEWVKKDEQKEEFLIVNKTWGFELKKAFIDSKLYLEDQKQAGVEHSIISPVPQLFMYDFPEDVETELSSVYNQSLAHWSHAYPGLISALGTVPLPYPEKAAEVLRDAMGKGLKGIIIGPGHSGQMLSDEFFAPLFEEANRLKAIVFIHPLLSEDPRLKRRKMANLAGVPWETTVCATDLLLSGFTSKYPNIKILLAHGGGFLPYQIGRMDKGFTQWKEVSANLEAPPSECIKQFYFDSVLWNKESFDFLIQTVGEDRVVPGSDYPFDLCEWPPQEKNAKGGKSLLST